MEGNKKTWFWWYNEKASHHCSGTDLKCKDDCVFAYLGKQENKVFAINEIIKNLQDNGIINTGLSRKDYRRLWMHLLVVNDDEQLKAFYQHIVADYSGFDFDFDDYDLMREYLAEAVAIGIVKADDHPEDMLARCVMVACEQDEGHSFEVLK